MGLAWRAIPGDSVEAVVPRVLECARAGREWSLEALVERRSGSSTLRLRTGIRRSIRIAGIRSTSAAAVEEVSQTWQCQEARASDRP